MKAIILLLITALPAFAQTNFFPELRSDSGDVIMTNAEFRSIVGRKMIFKQTDTGHLKPVDITEINAAALGQLKIDSNKAMEEQKRLDEAKTKAAQIRAEQAATVAAQQRAESARRQKLYEERARLAAEKAKQAEQDRVEAELRRLEIENKKAEIENTKARTRSYDRFP